MPYLLRDPVINPMLKTCHTVIAVGERHLSPVLAADLINGGPHPNPDHSKPIPLAALSDREIQVLRMIGKGYTTAVISKELSITTKTVRPHRENLKNKLNAGNSVSLVQKAILLVDNHVI